MDSPVKFFIEREISSSLIFFSPPNVTNYQLFHLNRSFNG